MSEETTIGAGGLEFKVSYREFAGDRGPAVQVFGDTDRGPVQILRFDCFDDGPHYHYDPDGMNGLHVLDRAVVPDVVAWTLVQLRRNLKAMVMTAGYPDLAESLDQGAVSAKVGEVEEAIQRLSA